MEVNFRNINFNITNPQNLTNKSVSNQETFQQKQPQNLLPQNMQTLNNSINTMQFNLLTRVDQALLIRELLNLPKDIKDLLTLLAFGADTPANTKLLEDMTKLILLSDMQNVLNASSKDILNKLIKLIQPTPGNIQNFDQLKEIISIVQNMIPSTNMSGNEVLKNVILLYLPWLPLVQPQDIAIEYKKKESQDEQGEDTALIIYITTENLGRLRGIIKPNGTNIHVQIESLNYEDSIKEHLKLIHKKINEEIKLNKIPATSEIHTYKSKMSNKSERREISVQPGSSISPGVLMAAYIITRVVFEFDESISLNKKRENMIQDKR